MKVVLRSLAVVLAGSLLWLAPAPLHAVTGQATATAAPVGVAVPTGEPSREEVDHVARLRSSLGLRSDAPYVTRLLSGDDPAALMYTDLFFLVLRPEEVEVVLERQRVQDRAHEVEAWALETFGSSFGGSYVEADGAGGTRMVVTATDTRGLTNADLPLALADIRASVAVVEVERTLDDLTGQMPSIEETLASAGVSSGGSYVDERTNEVVVLVEGAEGAAGDERLGAIAERPYVRFEEGGPVADLINKDQPLGYLVVEGGQAIGRASANDFYYCTSGFAVRSAYGPFILSAGHCGDFVGQMFRQGGHNLGEVSVIHNTGSFDGMLISTYATRNDRARLHITYADDYEPVGFITPGDQLGFIVCNTGMGSTGISGNAGALTRCGEILARAYDPGTGYTASFRVADVRADGSDSGAAIYRNTIYGISGEGVLKGCITTAPDECRISPYGMIYSYLPTIRNYWGLSLSPT